MSDATRNVVFLATRWGAAYGGINAFNEDLVVATAAVVENEVRIVCVALYAAPNEIEAARQRGILLLHIGNDAEDEQFLPGFSSEVLNVLRSHGVNNVNWWIGHDTVSGPCAIAARDATPNSRVALIHHMDLGAYEFLKEKRLPSEGFAKVREQRDMLRDADVVFAVGPKLDKSARDKLRDKGESLVTRLMPGLYEHPSVRKKPPSTFSAITFGRLERSNDRIKQASLAVKAFAKAVKDHPDTFGYDANLTVIGLSNDRKRFEQERRNLLKLAEVTAKRAVNIIAWPYITDRKELFEQLSDKSVCLMLSLHEGFGLTGWEAIAAEIPLIVSSNTGLYEAINDILGGMGCGCIRALDIRGSVGSAPFHREDVEVVARAIVNLRHRETEAKRDSHSLRRLLQDECQWKVAAIDFAKRCQIPIRSTFAKLEIAGTLLDRFYDEISTARDGISAVTKRDLLYDHVFSRLSARKRTPKLLVLFGGIASRLSDSAAAEKYANWLASQENATLFICYESGPAALSRASTLDASTLDPRSGSTNPIERMQQKEMRVNDLKHALQFVSETALGRIHFIRLEQYLTSYLILLDEELHLTPLFHRRSSDSISFTCAPKDVGLQQQARDYMRHHLQRTPDTKCAAELVSRLAFHRMP